MDIKKLSKSQVSSNDWVFLHATYAQIRQATIVATHHSADYWVYDKPKPIDAGIFPCGKGKWGVALKY